MKTNKLKQLFCIHEFVSLKWKLYPDNAVFTYGCWKCGKEGYIKLPKNVLIAAANEYKKHE